MSRHGVRSLLVEQHPGTSIHPKARGLNVRTLELLRVWGLEPAVRAAAKDLERALDVVLPRLFCRPRQSGSHTVAPGSGSGRTAPRRASAARRTSWSRSSEKPLSPTNWPT